MRRSVVVLSIVTLLHCSGCASTSEPWVFGLTRRVYIDGVRGDASCRFTERTKPMTGSDPRVFLLIPAILALPVVLDTILLPITIPHDVLVSR